MTHQITEEVRSLLSTLNTEQEGATANPQYDMAANIAEMGKAIITTYKEHWDEEKKRNKVKSLCKSIRKCDGSVNTEVREWIEEESEMLL